MEGKWVSSQQDHLRGPGGDGTVFYLWWWLYELTCMIKWHRAKYTQTHTQMSTSKTGEK